MEYAKTQMEYDNSGYQELYSSYIESEEMLTMADGIKLKTYLFKPIDKTGSMTNTSLPAILVRSCYPSQLSEYRIHGKNLAKRGYAFVVQFCRGTGDSEGEWFPNVNEREDGLRTINWLNEQEWVDVIGYWGNSYLALTGWAIADRVPDKVKGMCLTHYGTDRYYSAYEKGMFRQDVLTSWAMDNSGFKVTADYTESLKYMPQLEVDEKLWGGRLDWYRDWISSTHREDNYWQQGFWKELYEIPSKVKVPLYIRSGWYDHHHGSSMRTWDNLRPETKEKSWLDIGGWNHSFQPCLEDCSTENSGSNEVAAILEWFDLVLQKKEIPKGRIRTYAIGGDRWISRKSWPEKDSKLSIWYMGQERREESAESKTEKSKTPENKDLESKTIESKAIESKTIEWKTTENATENSISQDNNTAVGTLGILEKAAQADLAMYTYIYNPENPVISYGAEALLKNMEHNGSLKQPECGYRPDVICFVSEPLEANVLISGKIRAFLYVSSDCPDTAFTAKVMEIRESGEAYNIRSSITSLCHDIGHAYEPGTVEEVSIDMWDIVYELHKGSRLRLDISSSDFPQYHLHSNCAGNWASIDKYQIAVQKIYSGGFFASRIEIPANN